MSKPDVANPRTCLLSESHKTTTVCAICYIVYLTNVSLANVSLANVSASDRNC